MVSTAEPRLRSIDDTKRILGVGRTTVYTLIDSDALTAVKIGRRTLITQHSIDNYLEQL